MEKSALDQKTLNRQEVCFTITNLETTETSNSKQFVLYTDSRISTVIKVIKIYAYSYPDDTFQVDIACEALCSIGTVFKTRLIYFPDTQIQSNQLVSSVKENVFYQVEGKYSVYPKDPIGEVITIYDGLISHLSSEFPEEAVVKAFKTNRVGVE
jgi:hypothetical protein